MHEKRFDKDKDTLRSEHRINLLEVDRVISMVLEDIKPKNVLDVGIGTGLFAERFAQQGLHVSGIDANPEMIEAVKKILPHGEFRVAIAENIPFSDKSFDLVFMGVLLHETDDLFKTLQESYRVSKLRVGVLEWPYEEQEFGPPLNHRLKPEIVEETAKRVGFKNVTTKKLQHTVLYLFDV